MPRDNAELRDNIRWLRGVAEQGRHTPLLAGPILAAAGAIFATASLAQWIVTLSVASTADHALVLWVIWLGAGALFAFTARTLTKRLRYRSGSSSLANQLNGSLWSAIGLGIFVSWLTLAALSFATGHWRWMITLPAIVLVLYGIGWLVSAAIAEQRWMRWIALTSWCGALVTGLAGSNDALLLPLYALLLAAVALLPGLILMRRQRLAEGV